MTTMANAGWPSYSNDDGTGQTGTTLDSDFLDDIRDAIDAVCHSTTNTAVDPNDIIDEVVTARGSLGALDTRLDVSLNNDGTLKTQSGYATLAQVKQAYGLVNIIQNDTFLMWSKGLAVAPTFWTLTGAAASVARNTTGATTKIGAASCKVTRAGTDCYIEYPVLDSGAYDDFFDAREISVGVWAYTAVASCARITVNDGSTTTSSSYHAGDTAWEWLSCNHTISGAATELTIRLEVKGSNGDVYWDGVTAFLSDDVPSQWQPTPKAYGALTHPITGVPVVADGVFHYVFAKPFYLKDVSALLETAPGGAADFDLDVEKDETGAASYASVFSASQTIITAGAIYGDVAPDGAFDHRCLHGYSGGSVPADARVRLNIDTVGGNTSDAWIALRGLQYINFLDNFLARDDL